MHDLFNDTVFNTECAAQNFVRLFIVLQHAKSIGSVKLHVCVRVRACVRVCVCACAYTGCTAVYDLFQSAKFILRSIRPALPPAFILVNVSVDPR